MVADFVPGQSLSLKQAANDLGYTSFNFEQMVQNLPSPSPVFANSDLYTALTAPPAFSDPIAGGYTYQNDVAAENAYPFYFPLSEIQNYESGSLFHLDDNKLEFSDGPGDGCLFGGPGGAACLDERAPEGSQLMFSTALVGVKPDGSASGLLAGFDWESNYTGVSGGVSELSNPLPGQLVGGNGGVTILGLHYFDSGVPESETWTMLLAGAGMLGAMIRAKRSRQYRSSCV
jgi:hypothetical protein